LLKKFALFFYVLPEVEVIAHITSFFKHIQQHLVIFFFLQTIKGRQIV